MKTIIAGSRPPKDLRLNYRALDRWYNKNCAVVEAAVRASGFPVTEVLQGEAQGFDTLAARWAHWNRCVCYGYPAEWKRADGTTDYGAGARRNLFMAGEGEALIAIWDEVSRGAAHMVTAMASLGKPVFVWSTKLRAPLPDAVEKARSVIAAKRSWSNRLA